MMAAAPLRTWMLLIVFLLLPAAACKPTEQPRALTEVVEGFRFELPKDKVSDLLGRLEPLAAPFGLKYHATNHCPNRPCWSIFMMDDKIDISFAVSEMIPSETQGALIAVGAIGLKIGVGADSRIPELQVALRQAIKESGGVGVP